MNTLEVVAWNLRDGLTDPTVTDAQQQYIINDLQPDLAVFPEGRQEEQPLATRTLLRFQDAGYEVWSQNYNDTDGRTDRHGLVVLAKEGLVRDSHIVHLAGRSALQLTLHNGARFIGVHLDDRSEDHRVEQAKGILARAHQSRAAVVAGDFNAMHAGSASARLLRPLAPLANALPASDPGRDIKTPPLQRVGSLSQRLTAMAAGTTMRTLESGGLKDVARKYAPTMKKSVVTAQLDHIMRYGAVSVVTPTETHTADNLSDHKAVSAKVLL